MTCGSLVSASPEQTVNNLIYDYRLSVKGKHFQTINSWLLYVHTPVMYTFHEHITMNMATSSVYASFIKWKFLLEVLCEFLPFEDLDFLSVFLRVPEAVVEELEYLDNQRRTP